MISEFLCKRCNEWKEAEKMSGFHDVCLGCEPEKEISLMMKDVKTHWKELTKYLIIDQPSPIEIAFEYAKKYAKEQEWISGEY